mmetsp:Transcript_5164/g.13365  ORF Transcript_5164/g.13365 Transcript_5164/m.13365 type:complete len:298 (+) Transcript_5164:577-1470(+)
MRPAQPLHQILHLPARHFLEFPGQHQVLSGQRPRHKLRLQLLLLGFRIVLGFSRRHLDLRRGRVRRRAFRARPSLPRRRRRHRRRRRRLILPRDARLAERPELLLDALVGEVRDDGGRGLLRYAAHLGEPRCGGFGVSGDGREEGGEGVVGGGGEGLGGDDADAGDAEADEEAPEGAGGGWGGGGLDGGHEVVRGFGLEVGLGDEVGFGEPVDVGGGLHEPGVEEAFRDLGPEARDVHRVLGREVHQAAQCLRRAARRGRAHHRGFVLVHLDGAAARGTRRRRGPLLPRRQVARLLR